MKCRNLNYVPTTFILMGDEIRGFSLPVGVLKLLVNEITLLI
jgi:hypothetical protein